MAYDGTVFMSGHATVSECMTSAKGKPYVYLDLFFDDQATAAPRRVGLVLVGEGAIKLAPFYGLNGELTLAGWIETRPYQAKGRERVSTGLRLGMGSMSETTNSDAVFLDAGSFVAFRS